MMITGVKRSIGIMTLLGIMGLVFTQFGWAGLKEEFERLNALKEELRRESKARLDGKMNSYTRLKSLETKVYSAEDKLAELKRKKIDLEEKLYTSGLEKEEVETEYTERMTRKRDLENFLKDKAEYLKERIKNSLPYRREEELEKINSLKNLAGLFKFLQEELISARTTELTRGRVNGEEVEILKIGGIFSAYKSGGGEIGLLGKRLRKDRVIYRWDQEPDLKEKLTEAFNLFKEGKKGVFELPLDVTQGIEVVTAGAGEKGIWAWFMKGGPVMIPLGGVALAIFILVSERLLFFKREWTDPDLLMEPVTNSLRKGQAAEALKLCKTTPGPVARMLAAGLEQQQKGKRIVEETLNQQQREGIPKFEKYLSVIGVMAGVAPLLGLLGTVSGMINTFRVITYHGAADPRLLAGGISEALITTQFGLIIAVPALLLHNYLSNKADRVAADMQKSAGKLINSLPK